MQISLLFGTQFAGRFLRMHFSGDFKKMNDNDLWSFYLSGLLPEDK